jgi:hypothetical protein
MLLTTYLALDAAPSSMGKIKMGIVPEGLISVL